MTEAATAQTTELSSPRLGPGSPRLGPGSPKAPLVVPWNRVIVVANRLPVSAKPSSAGGGGPPTFTRSSGGLVSGLTSLRSGLGSEAPVWCGWPGGSIRDEHRDAARTALAEMGLFPVFLDAATATAFYDGECNGTLWPLLHSMPTLCRTVASEWDAYVHVNRLFADAVAEIYRPGQDLIFVQDYQLCLLPQMLRERMPDAPIAYFLHVPFPGPDMLRTLPQCHELINGLLGADLIGFHTMDYVANFNACVTRIAGLGVTLNRIMHPEGRVVQIGGFPMGIDFERYSGWRNDPELVSMVTQMRKQRAAKVLFSVSRLDYTKGVPNSMLAFSELLRKRPDLRGQLSYVLLVVPSRTSVPQYEELKHQIDRLVGEINGEFGTLLWSPIKYLFTNMTPSETIALYATADIALITPLRDGMNLVVKEYAAVHAFSNNGVLIISDLIGAAHELSNGAVVVNATAIESIVEAIEKALVMSPEEQLSRNTALGNTLQRNDIQAWGNAIFRALLDCLNYQQELAITSITGRVRRRIAKDFRNAENGRLVVLDYDGTLVPFRDDPKDCAPDSELLGLLTRLCKQPDTSVVFSSGRDRETLESWLGVLHDATIVAEHGSFVHRPGAAAGDWEPQQPPVGQPWKEHIASIMEESALSLPGSFVEEKENSIVFHYRAVDSTVEPKVVEDRVKALRSSITGLIAGLPLRIIDGSMALEVASVFASKGSFLFRHLASCKPAPGFVLVAGDDTTDEDMFSVSPESAYTIRVGSHLTAARFNAANHKEIRALLSMLQV